MFNSLYFLVALSATLNIEFLIMYYSNQCISLNKSYFLLLLSTFLGNYIFTQIIFFLGKLFGKFLVKKYETLQEYIAKIAKLFHKYGIVFILLFRYTYGIKLISPFILGCFLDNKLFSIVNIFASLIWSIIFTNVGYYLGNYILLDNSIKGIINIFILNFVVSFICSFFIFIYERYIHVKNIRLIRG